MLAWRIGAYYEEVFTGAQTAMSGACRQQQHIACTHVQNLPVLTTQHQLSMAACDTQHFVPLCM
ncbi:hypothetical protein [Pseudomonas sp. H1_D04]